MDASSILKLPLSRGEIQIIGATTVDEYRKRIMVDPALDRRFQTIEISEPDEDSTLEILRGVKKEYERFHGVRIDEEALKKVVSLSKKYILDRFFPDKALDLLDESCASLGLRGENRTLRAEDVDRAFAARQGKKADKSITSFNRTSFSDAMLREFPKEENAINTLASHFETEQSTTVRGAFALVGADSSYNKRFAKKLSLCLCGEDQFFSLDLSSYGERQSISALIGAEPGFIGYGEGGILSERIRRKPFSLLYIEHFPLASNAVKSLFYGALEKGEIYDGQGKRVGFGNCVIVFSYNAKTNRRISGFVRKEENESPALSVDETLLTFIDNMITLENTQKS